MCDCDLALIIIVISRHHTPHESIFMYYFDCGLILTHFQCNVTFSSINKKCYTYCTHASLDKCFGKTQSAQKESYKTYYQIRVLLNILFMCFIPIQMYSVD